jgi:hypothetical protein
LTTSVCTIDIIGGTFLYSRKGASIANANRYRALLTTVIIELRVVWCVCGVREPIIEDVGKTWAMMLRKVTVIMVCMGKFD